MRKTTLDWLKILCAVMVVYIHTFVHTSWGWALMVPCRVAVPIFFFCSGYFFRVKGQPVDSRHIRKRVLRLLRLFLTWYAVMFFVTMLKIGTDHRGFPSVSQWIEALRSTIMPSAILRCVAFGEVWGLGAFLWYLVSLIECELLATLAEKLRVTRFFHALSLPCLLLLIGLEIAGIVPIKLADYEITVHSVWLWGFWLFMMGDLIREREDGLHKLFSRGRLLILLGIAAALMIFEAVALEPMDFYFSSLLGGLSLMLLALGSNYRPTDRIPARILPQISLYIYLLHGVYATLLLCLFSLLPQYARRLSWLSFPMTLTLTLLTAAAIIFIKEKRRLRKKSSAS